MRVVPFAPLGAELHGDRDAWPRPRPTRPRAPRPRRVHATTRAPSTLPDANNAGEPSIGTNYKTGATIFQSYLSTYKVKFDDCASPATATWTDASANAANGCPQGSTTSLDPILFTDHQTGRTFESQLSGVDSLTCYTDDDGATWNPSTGGGIPSGVDHQTIGGGAFSAGGVGALPTSTTRTPSTTAARTSRPRSARSPATAARRSAPASRRTACSTAAACTATSRSRRTARRTCPTRAAAPTRPPSSRTDNGTTWTVSQGARRARPGDSDPSVGVGANGTVYFGYVGADGKPGMAVSHDQGKTWTDRQTVGTRVRHPERRLPDRGRR